MTSILNNTMTWRKESLTVTALLWTSSQILAPKPWCMWYWPEPHRSCCFVKNKGNLILCHQTMRCLHSADVWVAPSCYSTLPARLFYTDVDSAVLLLLLSAQWKEHFVLVTFIKTGGATTTVLSWWGCVQRGPVLPSATAYNVASYFCG